jgi:hypothetical protein
MVVLFVLVLTAAFAAILVGYRLYRDSMTAMIAGAGVWMLLIALPPYLLGWLDMLTPGRVGVTAALLSLAAIGAALGTGISNRPAFIVSALGLAVRLPTRGVRLAWQARSLAVLAPVAVALLAVWTAYISYLAPSNSWDGLWYHESIIGYALQNQGFAWDELPNRLQYVNGYPKMSEMFNLFAVIFSDRTLIDAVPSIMLLIAFVGTVGLVRPLVATPVRAMGWASVVVLLPAVFMELRSSLTDVTFLAGFVVALFFVTKPALRPPDMVLGALFTGMMGSMKGTGVSVAPLMFILLGIRIIRPEVRSPRKLTALALGVLVFSATVLFAPTYVRNWVVKGNPFWPVRYHNIPGVALDGPEPLRHTRAGALAELFQPPEPHQKPDTRDNGYGNVPPIVLPPLVVAAMLALLYGFARKKADPNRRLLFFALAVTAPSILVSPGGLWWARLHLHGVVLSVMLAAWVLKDKKWHALHEGVLGALIIGSLLTFVWTKPTWQMPVKRIARLSKRTPVYRENLNFGITMLPKQIAFAREREIRKGDVVAFDGRYPFHANLWNRTFSNRLVYLRPRTPPKNHQAVLDTIGAKWVVVDGGAPWDRVLGRDKKTWQEIGLIFKNNRAYRRLK